jgi:hypothetical protein
MSPIIIIIIIIMEWIKLGESLLPFSSATWLHSSKTVNKKEKLLTVSNTNI